ncbi:MAG TPA: MBL fold metallo-hydrolase [Bradyrhizobium sp.]|uniref:MBL fold metallo-hydrolase n=1 Tax=Bradyrhizobium sp. TaxID=376 RepID=UPI002D7F64F2|nr:MBL fold metallo-hydrolase [Bradyrhizobium sp.]HET7886344.1 MBL fold metallo-hydrolase [Bradyrhizobium sp.]
MPSITSVLGRVAAAAMLVGLLAAIGIVPAIAAEPAALVAAAIEKQGGAKKLSDIATLSITARHKHWDPQETLEPDQGNRLGGESHFTLSMDLAQNRARYDWVRHRVAPMKRTFIYSEVFADGAGFVLGEDNIVLSKQAKETNPSLHTMSASRVIANRREFHRLSPRLLVEMRDHPERLAALPDEAVDGKTLSVVSYKDDDAEWLVLFGDDGLPARIRTVDADGVWGDSNYDMILSDWREVDGVRLAFERSFTLNGHEVQHISIEEIVLNPVLGADLFRIPKIVAETAAKQKAPEQVNYQWMLRRANWGSFIDTDQLAFDPAVVPANIWTQVKPGIWHITGGSHHTLVVEMKDYLVAFDAPIANEMSRMTIAEAARRFPGKSFKYLVLTHHHMDHVNGARAFAARGADLVFPSGDRQYFAAQMRAPNRVRNDELWQKPREVGLIEVSEKTTLTDGMRRIDLYVINNSHARSSLVAVIPDADFGWVVDLWSPTRDIPGALASHREFVAGLRKFGVMPTLWAGGHGTGAAPIKPLLEALEKGDKR